MMQMYTNGSNGVSPTTSSTEIQVAAMLWRTQLQTALSVFDAPKRLSNEILGGNEAHLWRHLKKPDGTRFESFAEFCELPRPHGLGSSAEAVNKLLTDLYGARGAQLITVPESRQGKRTSRHDVAKSAGERKRDERSRTIKDAPESIQELYRRDLLGIEDAVLVGRFVRDGFDASKLIPKLDGFLQADGHELPVSVRREVKKKLGTVIRARIASARAAATGAMPSQPESPLVGGLKETSEEPNCNRLTQRVSSDPSFAKLVVELLDPKSMLGGLGDKVPMPPDLSAKFPKVSAYATLGDLRNALRSSATLSDAASPTGKKTKTLPAAAVYAIKVTARRSEAAVVTLKKAKFQLVIGRVLDSDGREIDDATVEIAVHDRTL
jgi:hypothetical protein